MSHLIWDFREQRDAQENVIPGSGDLLTWDTNTTYSFIHDLKITAQHDQDADATAFRLSNGGSDLRIERVRIDANEPNRWGSGLRLSAPGVDPALGSPQD